MPVGNAKRFIIFFELLLTSHLGYLISNQKKFRMLMDFLALTQSVRHKICSFVDGTSQLTMREVVLDFTT